MRYTNTDVHQRIWNDLSDSGHTLELGPGQTSEGDVKHWVPVIEHDEVTDVDHVVRYELADLPADFSDPYLKPAGAVPPPPPPPPPPAADVTLKVETDDPDITDPGAE